MWLVYSLITDPEFGADDTSMNTSTNVLSDRIHKLSDEGLLRILTTERQDYTQEAISVAEKELTARGRNAPTPPDTPKTNETVAKRKKGPPSILQQANLLGLITGAFAWSQIPHQGRATAALLSAAGYLLGGTPGLGIDKLKISIKAKNGLMILIGSLYLIAMAGLVAIGVVK